MGSISFSKDLRPREEIEEMEKTERERRKRVLEAITLAGNPQQIRKEIAELEDLAA
jgi:hypothetical protein